MGLPLTPTTELGAVNAMLASIGESPVNQLENSQVLDAVNARSTLHNISRAVQSVGWHWNTEYSYAFAASYPDGGVSVGTNVLKVRNAGRAECLNLVLRGSRFYNRSTFSYAISQTITADAVIFLAFDELPEPVRRYITLSAGRQFQEHFIGSEVLTAFTQRDEMLAWAQVENDEAEEADNSYLNDSLSVADAWFRPGGGGIIA